MENEGEAVRKGLRTLFRKARPTAEYTLPELAAAVRAKQIDAVVAALADLTRERVVDQVFRVESPKRGGIDDFPSLARVPAVIFDWRQGFDIPVENRLIKIIFRKHSETNASHEAERP